MKTGSQFYSYLLITLFLAACAEAPTGEGVSVREVKTGIYPQTPEEVVALFCESFFDAAPPGCDNEAAKTAYMLLSSSRQRDLNGVRAGLSGRLTLFTGVHEVPDHGFHIMGLLSKTEEVALVETCWHFYSEDEDSTAMVKVFALAMQEGHWKIDEIQRR